MDTFRWREEVPKILIFITDGRPQDRALVPRYAKSLRDKKIRIFAIGVGEATEEELKEIASTPHEDHVIFISGGQLQISGTSNITSCKCCKCCNCCNVAHLFKHSI